MLKKLVEMNFNAGVKGIYYLAEAIQIKKENIMLGITDIYNLIAEKNNSSWQKIERNIRTCITTSSNKYKNLSNLKVIGALAIIL